MEFSQASWIAPGAVIMIEFDSSKAIAIFDTVHVWPNSPLHMELNFSATSRADAWLSL